MQPLMPSSQVRVQGVQVAWLVDRHWQNPDLKMSVEQMTLHSFLCQQFFQANQSMPVARELGANVHPWRTPDQIVNQALSDSDAMNTAD